MVPNRLDLRRVAGLAGASLAVVLLTCGYTFAFAANSSDEQATEIIHQPLRCWPAEEYVVVSVDVRPPGHVQKNLAYFRWDRHAQWYFVPMTLNAQGAWVAILPKTQPETTGIVYVFESISSSYMATRSEEFRVPVRPASQCENAGAVVYMGANPNITLGATSGTPLAPGFQASGISSFVSPTGMTSAVTGGGGVSGRTLALIGGAGGAAAFFAFSGGDGEATTTADGIGGISTTASTTTTASGGGTTTGSSSSTTTPGGGGSPTSPTTGPTSSPTTGPTTSPTTGPTTSPTTGPTTSPTTGPTTSPTTGPTTSPTTGPTTSPTTGPTTSPTTVPTTNPTTAPTTNPTTNPTTSPTTSPGTTNVTVTKTDARDPISVGEDVVYTITVRNNGPGTAAGVRATDNVPGGLQLFAADGDCGIGGSCICGTMTAGSVCSGRMWMRANTSGTKTNTVNLVWVNPDNSFGTGSTSERTTVTSSLRTHDSDNLWLSYRSTLGVTPPDGRVRGRIAVNEASAHTVDNAGPRVHRSRARRGRNFVEARLETGMGRQGFWSFDFSISDGFAQGSFEIETGRVVSRDSHSITFALTGSAEPIRFSVELQVP